jgi:hypothetical protein
MMGSLVIAAAPARRRQFNPALFARLADSDEFALIPRSRALRRESCYACAQPIGNADYAVGMTPLLLSP